MGDNQSFDADDMEQFKVTVAASPMGAGSTGSGSETNAHSAPALPGSAPQNSASEDASQDLLDLKDQFSRTTPSFFKTLDSDTVANSIAAHYADYTDVTSFLSAASFIKTFLADKGNEGFTAEAILSDTAAFEKRLTESMSGLADHNAMKEDLPAKLSEYLQAIRDRNAMSWLLNTFKTMLGK